MGRLDVQSGSLIDTLSVKPTVIPQVAMIRAERGIDKEHTVRPTNNRPSRITFTAIASIEGKIGNPRPRDQISLIIRFRVAGDSIHTRCHIMAMELNYVKSREHAGKCKVR
jgi:hypothetical protein